MVFKGHAQKGHAQNQQPQTHLRKDGNGGWTTIRDEIEALWNILKNNEIRATFESLLGSLDEYAEEYKAYAMTVQHPQSGKVFISPEKHNEFIDRFFDDLLDRTKTLECTIESKLRYSGTEKRIALYLMDRFKEYFYYVVKDLGLFKFDITKGIGNITTPEQADKQLDIIESYGLGHEEVISEFLLMIEKTLKRSLQEASWQSVEHAVREKLYLRERDDLKLAFAAMDAKLLRLEKNGLDTVKQRKRLRNMWDSLFELDNSVTSEVRRASDVIKAEVPKIDLAGSVNNIYFILSTIAFTIISSIGVFMELTNLEAPGLLKELKEAAPYTYAVSVVLVLIGLFHMAGYVKRVRAAAKEEDIIEKKAKAKRTMLDVLASPIKVPHYLRVMYANPAIYRLQNYLRKTPTETVAPEQNTPVEQSGKIQK